MILSWFFWFLFFVINRDHGTCLIMERLEIPGLAKLFQPLKIACRFRLGTLRLESVKWYKDDNEFFRFTPSARPQIRKFNISGIAIDMEKSDMHMVSLINVSVSSAGVYRCEVSSDSPDFETVQESRRMDVFYQPDRPPRVAIDKTEIHPNEDIVAQCVTDKSFPVQKIFWFLNGIEVNKNCIKKEYTKTDENGLLSTYSWVRVRAKGGPGPILVSCVESQGQPFPSQRTYLELALRKYTDNEPMPLKGTANYVSMDFKRYNILTYVCAILIHIQPYVIWSSL